MTDVERLRREFVDRIATELDRAYAKHGREPWGRHEFYAILKEEVDELWDAIKSDQRQDVLLNELVQVAAMCFRYLETGDRYRGALVAALDGEAQRGKLCRKCGVNTDPLVALEDVEREMRVADGADNDDVRAWATRIRAARERLEVPSRKWLLAAAKAEEEAGGIVTAGAAPRFSEEEREALEWLLSNVARGAYLELADNSHRLAIIRTMLGTPGEERGVRAWCADVTGSWRIWPSGAAPALLHRWEVMRP